MNFKTGENKWQSLYFCELFFFPQRFPQWLLLLKIIYSEKATKFYEICSLLLTVCTVVKSKGKISQNFVAISEYMNFSKFCVLWKDFVCRQTKACAWPSFLFLLLLLAPQLSRASMDQHMTELWGGKNQTEFGLGEILVCPWLSSRFASDPYSFYCHTYMFYVGLKYTNNDSEVGFFFCSF